ncbi:hypothetical protein [Micavibrio aeruginosavorus]|uniref:Uncharacterized protein n=1 Tax=Micavibrio aeruginosavorus EPB TaxID=349215 RepID=M4VJT7_9BACT|nr:hypothetical protein [Micavibrio aeruginosavorus]AGH98326.1 hypothetical protein A11S_1520 [Micavibrio aeruginosavorus EPB]
MWAKIFNTISRFHTKMELVGLEAELSAAKGGFSIATGSHGGAMIRIDEKTAQSIIARTEKEIAALKLKL